MKKIYLSQPKVSNYWHGGLIGAACLLYILGHIYFPEYPPDFSGGVFFLAVLVIRNRFLKFRDSSYLVFGQENLTFGSANVTLWHFPLLKLSHLARDSMVDSRAKNNLGQVFIYTTEGEKYSLPQGIITEEKLAEITAEIAQIKIGFESAEVAGDVGTNKIS